MQQQLEQQQQAMISQMKIVQQQQYTIEGSTLADEESKSPFKDDDVNGTDPSSVDVEKLMKQLK